MGWTRYAIYWLPDGPLGQAGAEWLGWDLRGGRSVSAPAPGTERPRRYGFHATIKPPFRLAPGSDEADLLRAAAALAAGLAPVDLGRLSVTHLSRFLALVPDHNPRALAAEMVTGLDRFRAAAPPEEIAKRRAAGLTEAQEALLVAWGYPYVLEEFRMHLTLTGPDPSPGVETRAREVFGPLAGPYVMDRLSLVGEARDGWFHWIADLPVGRDTGTERAPRMQPTL